MGRLPFMFKLMDKKIIINFHIKTALIWIYVYFLFLLHLLGAGYDKADQISAHVSTIYIQVAFSKVENSDGGGGSGMALNWIPFTIANK